MAMPTEEEEYYDSIDDAEFEECCSFCNGNFQENDSDADDANDEQTTKTTQKLNQLQLIPFYGGNVDRSEIDSKSNSVTTVRQTKLKRRKPILSLTDGRKNRSYLTMFYAKIGQTRSEAPGSSRTVFSSALSPGSTEFNPDCINCQEKTHSRQESCRTRRTDFHETAAQLRCESAAVFGTASKLLSVSEAHFNSMASSRERYKREAAKDKYRNVKPLKIGELGGLGPNAAHEKLELLKRRQDYGKAVNEKNRVKILETKLIKKLKQEIRESRKN